MNSYPACSIIKVEITSLNESPKYYKANQPLVAMDDVNACAHSGWIQCAWEHGGSNSFVQYKRLVNKYSLHLLLGAFLLEPIGSHYGYHIAVLHTPNMTVSDDISTGWTPCWYGCLPGTLPESTAAPVVHNDVVHLKPLSISVMSHITGEGSHYATAFIPFRKRNRVWRANGDNSPGIPRPVAGSETLSKCGNKVWVSATLPKGRLVGSSGGWKRRNKVWVSTSVGPSTSNQKKATDRQPYLRRQDFLMDKGGKRMRRLTSTSCAPPTPLIKRALARLEGGNTS